MQGLLTEPARAPRHPGRPDPGCKVYSPSLHVHPATPGGQIRDASFTHPACTCPRHPGGPDPGCKVYSPSLHVHPSTPGGRIRDARFTHPACTCPRHPGMPDPGCKLHSLSLHVHPATPGGRIRDASFTHSACIRRGAGPSKPCSHTTEARHPHTAQLQSVERKPQIRKVNKHVPISAIE
ncbi:hypothetical protein NDU88_009365 [Pleurodeles waltl]|uniref:Uncharacterized protein n=1 Tax=Pleurodeles waltl TaxID=8319 RepID=A0AAV7P1Y9_PLEWA|nr:hypothetical protein NDU88_009365 [Pleurodeles waltl]